MALSRGGRNLLILGVGSILIALGTTAVSLAVYHSSGDIYLDRSRPGYLPEEPENPEEEASVRYVFPENGQVDKQALNEYLNELNKATETQRSLKEPFAPEPLSNKSLGIPDAKETDASAE